MRFKYSSLFSPRIFSIISFTVIMLFSFTAKAQYYSRGSQDDYSGYGVALNAGYDVPVGNLSYTFKPATAYGLTLLSFHDSWTTSVSFGYHAYKPKQDTFYYQVDEHNYGTISYQNYTAYSLYLGAAYNLDITDGLRAYGGINFGAYFTHMVSHSSDAFVSSNSDLHEENIYLAPKIGLNFKVSDNIFIGVEGKYNTFAIAGQKSSNEEVGTVYNSYAGNLVLTYKF